MTEPVAGLQVTDASVGLRRTPGSRPRRLPGPSGRRGGSGGRVGLGQDLAGQGDRRRGAAGHGDRVAGRGSCSTGAARPPSAGPCNSSGRTRSRRSTHCSPWARCWTNCCASIGCPAPTVRRLRPGTGHDGTVCCGGAGQKSCSRWSGCPRTRSPVTRASFSGGQRQRIAIARALAVEPRVLVADEPTSSLDVSSQRTVLDVLAGLGRQMRLATLLISHDLSVIHAACDDVAVLRDGVLLEHASATRFFRHPEHAYSRALLEAVPRLPGPR